MKVEAYIHSLKDQANDRNVLGEADIIECIGDNQYLAEYNGIRCTAIFNIFAGRYFVDDVYGVLSDTNIAGNRYYYTFGSSPDFPYQNGWVVVYAGSWEEAHRKFRARFPDRHKGILNCAFFYEESRWRELDPEHNWHGWTCWEVIK